LDGLEARLFVATSKAQMRLSRLLVEKVIEKTFGIKLKRKKHRHKVIHIRLRG
jgi:hypothetical protein